ncbi:MAG: exosortase/archaeosortase family protein [Candidatus Micrarchaeaceae archaeon]
MDDAAKGVVVFALAVFIITVSAYLATPLEILDTNPSTYVVVPLLMLPIFALLMYKERMVPKTDKKSVLIAVSLFVLFIIALLSLRFWLSFEFISFSVYFLIFPLAITSFAIAIFGTRNIGKFKYMLLYSIFASPAVIWPILRLDPSLANANTLLIFSLLKPIVHGIRYIAPISIGTANSLIGIGQTCISTGVFVAVMFFLLPLAYFYNGKISRKIIWLTSGVALLLLLNFLRMFSITYFWLAYGPNQELALIHEFIGSILFYITIIVMLLIAGKFGLSVVKISSNSRKPRKKASHNARVYAMALVMVLVFAIMYMLLTLNYSTAFEIQATALANETRFNPNNMGITKSISTALLAKGFKNIYARTVDGISFLAWNSTINASDPLLLYLTEPGLGTTAGILKNNTLKAKTYFFDKNGTSSELFDIISNGTEFFIYYTRVAFVSNNDTSEIANAYVVVPSYLVKTQTCNAYDKVYTYAYNLFNPALYNKTEMSKGISAYCIATKMT